MGNGDTSILERVEDKFRRGDGAFSGPRFDCRLVPNDLQWVKPVNRFAPIVYCVGIQVQFSIAGMKL